MPRGEEVLDALQALVTQSGRETGGLAEGEALRGHRSRDVVGIPYRLREHAAQPRIRKSRLVPLDVADVLDDRRGPGTYRLQGRYHHH